MDHFRKAVTAAVTFVVVYTLDKWLGLTPGDLPSYGLSLTDIREPVVELLITGGPAIVALIAQPDKGDRRSLWSQWRWLLGGAVVLVVLTVLAVLVL